MPLLLDDETRSIAAGLDDHEAVRIHIGSDAADARIRIFVFGKVNQHRLVPVCRRLAMVGQPRAWAPSARPNDTMPGPAELMQGNRRNRCLGNT